MEEILLKLRRLKNDIDNKIDGLDASFEGWKLPWTQARAEKIDRLDANVSSRADGASYTPARATKLDYLNANVSSRADGASYTPARAEKLDRLDATISSRAKDTDVQTLLSRGAVRRVQRGYLAPGSSLQADLSSPSLTFFYADVTLPYAVDLSKSTESAYFIFQTANANAGIVCRLISPTVVRLQVAQQHGGGSTNKLTGAISWTVEEWY